MVKRQFGTSVFDNSIGYHLPPFHSVKNNLFHEEKKKKDRLLKRSLWRKIHAMPRREGIYFQNISATFLVKFLIPKKCHLRGAVKPFVKVYQTLWLEVKNKRFADILTSSNIILPQSPCFQGIGAVFSPGIGTTLAGNPLKSLLIASQRHLKRCSGFVGKWGIWFAIVREGSQQCGQIALGWSG